MSNMPRGREKRVTDNSKGVNKRGSGLGTGPVGNRKGSSTSTRSASPVKGPISIVALIAMLLFGGGSSMLGLFDDSSTTSTPTASTSSSSVTTSEVTTNVSQAFSIPVAQTQTATVTTTSSVDTSVVNGARDKYTKILGNGKDTTTIMLYLCGTDLESRSGMATSDLKEIAMADSSDNINIIIFTGGCTGWKLNGISNNTNQIYQIKNGKMYALETSFGNKSMTDPATLTEFINYCTKNYPANRNDLILWDHGGGSVSGYGYDQRFTHTGSMKLSGIDKALGDAGVKFDFIGFDACLMATAENALMLNDYADYLIASEETEPGIGWYYTDWLTKYAKNPSMDTLSIGKNIVDGFVEECNVKCKGQLTTLSVIDLAEFAYTVPEKLKQFSIDSTKMIQNSEYQQLAQARQNSREFATSTKIDQVDLVDLAKKVNTTSSNELASVIMSAVKYNRTSSNMTNAYGVSVYFPNRKLSSVDTAVSINNSVGMDSEYNSFMKEYASLQLSGQTVSSANGYTGNPYSSLIGELSSSGNSNSDVTAQILQNLLYAGLNSLASGGKEFVADRSMSFDDTVEYITNNQFDASALVWKNGKITLSEEQWNLVTDLELSMFYDDGEGYIDLGCDNVFEFDEQCNLLAPTDNTWLAINGQPVAYYHTSTAEYGNDNYTITGYVPAYVNGERVKLLLSFDQDNPYGTVNGYCLDYKNDETDTVAKVDSELVDGDVIDFICDYYDYNGNYQDSYYLGEPMVVNGELEISNVDVGDGGTLMMYKFTDIYGQEYWSEVVE